jgi:hypothetical protein
MRPRWLSYWHSFHSLRTDMIPAVWSNIFGLWKTMGFLWTSFSVLWATNMRMGQVTYEITRLPYILGNRHPFTSHNLVCRVCRSEPLTHSHVASRSGCGREDALLTLGDGRALCWEGHKGHLMDLRFFGVCINMIFMDYKWGGADVNRGTRNHLKLDQGLKPMVTTGVPLWLWANPWRAPPPHISNPSGLCWILLDSQSPDTPGISIFGPGGQPRWMVAECWELCLFVIL